VPELPRHAPELPRALQPSNPNMWFWAALLVVGAILPTFYVDDYVYSVLVLFGLYGAINLMWSLVIGTAGILSFATLAFVGVGAYLSTFLSINHGWSWPEMFAVSVVAGAALGVIVAAPAIRLRGVYFALLTFGLVELFRSYASLSDDLGLAYGLFGTESFVPSRFDGTETGSIIAYYAAFGLLVVALLVYWAIDGGRLGLLLRTARESEPVAKAVGIDVVRARFAVFVVSSAVLGLTGAFYASYYKGVSPSIFDFGKVLLLFAMMVVGGIGTARGVLIGTALLLFIDQHFLSSGPSRFIAAGVLMLLVTLFTDRGLDGIPEQVRGWNRTRQARRREEAGAGARDREVTTEVGKEGVT
jgi:branched-chain amino acid transport system permease protein